VRYQKGERTVGKKQLVLAFYASEDAADEVVKQIKEWDKASKDIKLGSIGVLVKDEKGKVKTHKLGARHTTTGAAAGVLAAVLSGGVSLVGGVVLGSLVGAFIHKGLGMSKEDLARIGGELDGGKAAVAVLAEPDEADAVSAKLTELGGTVETHEVSDEAIEQAAEATQSAPETTEGT
jgi:uncharacterized membrane protein